MCCVVCVLSLNLFTSMKKNIPVIGYQPDRLCTRKDLELFDRIWWSQTPNAVIERNYQRQPFHLTEVAKHAFTKGISLFKL